ncbi:alpha/beta hydrolase family protein [Nocardioides acrostichi]|uniref:Hydrolase n=1 Tax=Nocardioides acrostichi TaxID=2784339 RepID=A0A930UVD0_9ACTN|nr:alpha/beta family hydrolase [Nocardioides acrostichi]MBF4160871.1 hydrolase [Nocardioides acrostichi]
MTPARHDVETSHGPGRLEVHEATGEPVAVVLLSHGAGAGIDTRDLVALAQSLPAQGYTVALFEQPWRVTGRKVATPPPTLDDGLRAAAARLGEAAGAVPLVLGGRSAGARSALRTAGELGAVAVLGLAFPLHPPGKPEKSRLAELEQAGVPVLLVQGDRDPMGRPEEFPDPLPDGAEMAVLPGGDHSFGVLKSGPLDQAEAMEMLVEAVLEWLARNV